MQLEGDLLRDFHTDLSVGDILRRERVRRGLTLDDVELATKISKTHLIAIEETRLELLPGRIYALGFIRSYGEHLGLDGNKLIQLLKRQSGKSIEPPPVVTLPTAMVADDASLPTIKTFFILLVSFILLASVGPRILDWYTGKDSALPNEQDGVPPVPADLKQQMTLMSKPTTKPAAEIASAAAGGIGEKITAPASAPPAASNPVVLKAIANVWLEIRDADRKTIFSRVLSAGEEYWVPPEQTGLVMTLGNAGGLTISLNGEDLPLLGRTGKVIRNIVLDPEKLKERLKNVPKKAM
jgi:cytoskeleton protein RodZ